MAILYISWEICTIQRTMFNASIKAIIGEMYDICLVMMIWVVFEQVDKRKEIDIRSVKSGIIA